MNPLILSGSSLKVYLECPKEWEFAYLWAKHMPPSYKMALGTAAHAAVEHGLKGILEDDARPLASWIEQFDLAWFEETTLSRPKNDKPIESAEAYRRSGHDCVAFYYQEIAPTVIPVLVEEPMAYTINGHTWTGTLDLLDALPDGRLRLRDHKFTGEKPRDAKRYMTPMIGYYLGARRLFGDRLSDEVVVDYIVRGRKITHHQILITIDEGAIMAFATDVEEAATAINAGRFPPLGRTNGTCRWCPYRRTCPDARI